jgi:hypothetical protein
MKWSGAVGLHVTGVCGVGLDELEILLERKSNAAGYSEGTAAFSVLTRIDVGCSTTCNGIRARKSSSSMS